ncbi:MAG: hypothetical protein L0Y54_11405 [Sporichthyaceae bacterium]|nr:hypothetical protein [Sporichthyaceae bacterium]
MWRWRGLECAQWVPQEQLQRVRGPAEQRWATTGALHIPDAMENRQRLLGKCPDCNGSEIRLVPVPTVGAQGWMKIRCHCDGGYLRLAPWLLARIPANENGTSEKGPMT